MLTKAQKPFQGFRYLRYLFGYCLAVLCRGSCKDYNLVRFSRGKRAVWQQEPYETLERRDIRIIKEPHMLSRTSDSFNLSWLYPYTRSQRFCFGSHGHAERLGENYPSIATPSWRGGLIGGILLQGDQKRAIQIHKMRC